MSEWVAVCTKGQLIPERGVAVLVREQQVALFRVTGTDEKGDPADFVYAVGHRDPFADANVIARGIVGSVGHGPEQRDTVASPMYKHVFALATGECLTDPSESLPVYRTWIAGGVVYVHPVPVSLLVA
ncbi:MAG: nitrite reductase [Marmoricola sp.]|nr:nitrite reductase [Marmoricola sp.]